MANSLDLRVGIHHCKNPRVENEKEQYFHPINDNLRQLGFHRTHTLERELRLILADLSKYRDRIDAKAEQIMPRVCWETGKIRMTPEQVRQSP